jgi:hypothetical protein
MSDTSPTAELTTEDILEAFATAGHVLPRAALQQAAAHWTEVGPTLLEMLEAVAEGQELTSRADLILFFGIYLMAQVRETRAFRPLCAIAAHSEQISDLIEDGITEDLSIILARTYDGDPAPLRRLIEDPAADEYARNAALGALAWLTAIGQIDRDETARYLRDLYSTLQPRDECYVWVGWQRAIANLGLADLVSLVETAFDRGWIDPGVMGRDHFHENLRVVQQATDPISVFDRNMRDDGRLDDVALHFSHWYAFNQKDERNPRQAAAPKPRTSTVSARPAHRNVGRNDPCPCGSGKKYKKCCLTTVR